MGLHSLREKLLQAGLVTDEQAKKSEADRTARPKGAGGHPAAGRGQRAGGGEQRRGPHGASRPGSREGQRKQDTPPPRELTPEEKLAREEAEAFRLRERELAREREENRRRAVEDRRRLETIREIAEKNEIAERGEEAFHFTSRKKKILRVYLTPAQLAQLEAGELAIVDKPLPAELSYALVGRAAAEQVVRLDPKAVRFFNQGEGKSHGFHAEEGGEAPQPAPEKRVGGALAQLADEIERRAAQQAAAKPEADGSGGTAGE